MEVKNYWNRTTLGTALAAMRLTALISYKLGYSDKEIVGDGVYLLSLDLICRIQSRWGIDKEVEDSIWTGDFASFGSLAEYLPT